MKLYVVQGSCRDYSYGYEWLIAAYTDQEAANQHCELANEHLKTKPRYEDSERLQEWAKDNPYDRSREEEEVNYYQVREVDLFRHVDEYQELR